MSIDNEVSNALGFAQVALSGSHVLTVRSNHTQSTAYLVGHKAASKLITEYGL